MANYELVFRKSVAKDLRQLPNKDVKRILERIRALATEPRPAGCEKLSGQERYRIRQGDYRIVYEIEDFRLIVLIVKVGSRLSLKPARGMKGFLKGISTSVKRHPDRI